MPIHRTSRRRKQRQQRNRLLVTWAKWTAIAVSVVLLAATAVIMVCSHRTAAKESGPLPPGAELRATYRVH